MLLEFGSQPVATPLASSAAIRLRGCPPTFVNWPPTYIVDPTCAMLNTVLFAFGFQRPRAPT